MRLHTLSCVTGQAGQVRGQALRAGCVAYSVLVCISIHESSQDEELELLGDLWDLLGEHA